MMQADRGSIISPSKATADLQASRPSWKAGRQLGHALDQQVSSLTWYQPTDKCWHSVTRPAGESKAQQHTKTFTTAFADITGITGINPGSGSFPPDGGPGEQNPPQSHGSNGSPWMILDDPG